MHRSHLSPWYRTHVFEAKGCLNMGNEEPRCRGGFQRIYLTLNLMKVQSVVQQKVQATGVTGPPHRCLAESAFDSDFPQQLQA